MFSHRTVVTTIVCGVSFFLVELLGGCAETMRREQLARVAKDWCQVVRASQVIPVYPLTEDLVPGDMFLVRMSIPQQHREYQKRGFLPMDMHLTRLEGLDYGGVYQESHGTRGKKNKMPYSWIFPPDGNAPATLDELRSLQGGSDGADDNEPQQRRHADSTLWPTAPRAAFPSYTFQVDARGGIQVALPIKGIPVALSLMQTDEAVGSVTLYDAYTYGVPYDKLIRSVSKWAEVEANRLTLMKIRRGVNEGNTVFSKLEDIKKFFMYDKNERTVYLRVISRVYVVGAVSVALINARAGAADAQIGAARDIELPKRTLQVPQEPGAPKPPASGDTNPDGDANRSANGSKTASTALIANQEAAKSFLQTLEAVNANLGGAVKLQWATARSVALDETFPRPLVIGYLGFDFPIDNSGFLQCPIATQYQVEAVGGSNRITVPLSLLTSARLQDRIGKWLEQNPKANEPKLKSWQEDQSIQAPVDEWSEEQLGSAVKDLKIPE